MISSISESPQFILFTLFWDWLNIRQNLDTFWSILALDLVITIISWLKCTAAVQIWLMLLIYKEANFVVMNSIQHQDILQHKFCHFRCYIMLLLFWSLIVWHLWLSEGGCLWIVIIFAAILGKKYWKLVISPFLRYVFFLFLLLWDFSRGFWTSQCEGITLFRNLKVIRYYLNCSTVTRTSTAAKSDKRVNSEYPETKSTPVHIGSRTLHCLLN